MMATVSQESDCVSALQWYLPQLWVFSTYTNTSCHPQATDKKSFATFGLGSILQLLVANWKNIPASFTDKEVF